ncbi:hypothetical protein [Arthrobacter wenxiniae]|uniref:Uncharacterized protein n=1 Tax=Arthrobacter wenxiniae TaxID=2713570 RepID=A0A7Y7IJG6_9MICC|nr:hypothetical protein [Arthrobacter wenxiniae]NVM96432.1 hypothetical protein [Arthrobacter wenxiniae]
MNLLGGRQLPGEQHLIVRSGDPVPKDSVPKDSVLKDSVPKDSVLKDSVPKDRVNAAVTGRDGHPVPVHVTDGAGRSPNRRIPMPWRDSSASAPDVNRRGPLAAPEDP